MLLNQPGGEYCKYHPKANALIVHAAPSKVAELKSILQQFDRTRPLIRVQVDIVDVDNRPERIIGIDWTNTPGSAAKPFAIDFVNSIASALTGTFTPLFSAWNDIGTTHLAAIFQPPQVSALFHAMECKGLLKVVARMVSVSEDNTPGKITAARQELIPNFSANQTTGGFDINGFEYKDIGSVGLCTPTIVGASVRVKLKSSLSSLYVELPEGKGGE
jgi:type II secretory pathway component GspD/PulD (secretin)